MAPFKPTLILHGGAGNIRRATLPPSLYTKYHASLTAYLRTTRDMLYSGSSALDAAVHAVSLMEDDELFNAGRGSVFTSKGTIEMEASVMVTSLNDNPDPSRSGGYGEMKRGAGVMGLKNVRNPIKLAREILRRTPYDEAGNPVDGNGGGSMHSQLVGPYVEELAKEQNWGIEFMPDEWFWTKRRWDEHRRGLGGTGQELFGDRNGTNLNCDGGGGHGEVELSMSQGTVGCVCLDQWGNLAVATSTGGMTNKWPGRIGDTPTLGAGFWAEDWESQVGSAEGVNGCGGGETEEGGVSVLSFVNNIRYLLGDCLPRAFRSSGYTPVSVEQPTAEYPSEKQSQPQFLACPTPASKRRAVAVSGTGNGDSFLRVAAARTACAMLRFSSSRSLADAVTAVAGPGGELQRSAGQRWGKTGEGEGGMIGIEAETDADANGSLNEEKERRGKPVFNFNCNGMWRAWIDEDSKGKDRERVMVFREEYH